MDKKTPRIHALTWGTSQSSCASAGCKICLEKLALILKPSKVKITLECQSCKHTEIYKNIDDTALLNCITIDSGGDDDSNWLIWECPSCAVEERIYP